MRAILRTTTAAVLALALTACGTSGAEAPAASGGPAEAPSGGSAPTSEPSGEVVVFAAASLTDALEAIAADLEAATPGLDVVFSFAGSQQLAAQIAEGAPADVFASADETQMDVVADAGLVAGEPRTFARNSLAIAVEPGNPLGIRGLADLARADVTLVLADEDVPAGRYAAAALEAAGVTVAPASLEVDVRAVLSKVALGEADAAPVTITQRHLAAAVAREYQKLGEPIYILESNPTVERIAKLIFDQSRELGVNVVAVRVWETPSSYASYSA